MVKKANAGDFKGIPLRAHHLLCMLGFQGVGYTAEFIKNFYKVKRMIDQNPDMEIEVVDSCDVICLACPNAQGEDCFKGGLKLDSTVKEMDRRVMNKLGIKPGDRFKAKDLYTLIKEKIRPEDFKDICRGCEWLALGFCPRGLEKLAPEQ
ncbi:DUF1284 domain-containing protein [Methanocella sp. CWC-04]|uniref:DUF1284 domain-containing protein n=1 Tax=Methanooceanicella nereidis TaxID=2052831 RepID=A0AAP2W5E5_9EURY|nr:DUF1284 domain-containing protein [Methanocella sp. CWC-04]MCD1294223.1 DUF1284 domain-containing protein [Methanocella sp. CWC-04]